MTTIPIRREPPRFRAVVVRRVEPVTPRLVQVTFGGDDLAGLTVAEPAASVRLLLPSVDRGPLEIPVWNGNEFRLRDGTRPVIRTFTPRRFDLDANELQLQMVVHDGGGIASDWATRAEPGLAAAISGTGRGYTVDAEARAFVLAGDETALPAMSQLLEHLPVSADVRVDIEITTPDARLDLGAADVHWHVLPADRRAGDALVAAVQSIDIRDGARIWVAGEAAAVQRIRKHLFNERGIARAQTTVRGYWKLGVTDAEA
jgi:NADPH-dependent ferric siderophore reductase